ncbi:hypothetical protein [Calothrix sp. 336/3]|uniref:hypothetical protein n=1 Tax=Calothrix sp. 336/3 TaxID=1337936 RepID=UPI0004E45725|nr:hypothetical protein [Calothrix sp. 336/3]AKG23013.1 hypothetical protein IJ00_18570 [Calothrix sp. 336/3]
MKTVIKVRVYVKVKNGVKVFVTYKDETVLVKVRVLVKRAIKVQVKVNVNPKKQLPPASA